MNNYNNSNNLNTQTNNGINDLKQLKELAEQGIITQEEFEAKKNRFWNYKILIKIKENIYEYCSKINRTYGKSSRITNKS